MTERKKKQGFFKGIKNEFRKITWPTKKEVVKSTAVVLVSLITVSALIKLIDLGLNALLRLAV